MSTDLMTGAVAEPKPAPAGSVPAEPWAGVRRYVSPLVWAIVVLTLLVIPLRIIGYGYLPVYDDALPDAAKAVSGKTWSEILVLRSSYTMDHHIGWHTVLRVIHLCTHCGTEGLVLISVVGLFVLFGWSVLPWLKRPEAWLGALILVASALPPEISRLMLGRPLVVTMTTLLAVLFLWQARGSIRPGWGTGAVLTILIAIAVLLHGIWYFWLLPVAAFFLARQYRWGCVLAASWIAGTMLAALLTGNPFEYITGAVRLAFTVIGLHANQRTLVTELRPTSGNVFPLVLMGALLVLRQFTGRTAQPLHRNPAFWLACLGWVLGFKASRFWQEWGFPALLVLMVMELQALLHDRVAVDSFKRLALAAGLAATLFLATTNDNEGRWTYNLGTEYVTEDNPELKGWLPEEGGIFYDVDMFFFYQTFFKNPHAPWRYMVGNEPALMPDEDLAVYQRILWNNRDPRAYWPWVEKMRPADRLAIRPGPGAPPSQVLPLEWKYACGLWIGRLPREGDALRAPKE